MRIVKGTAENVLKQLSVKEDMEYNSKGRYFIKCQSAFSNYC